MNKQKNISKKRFYFLIENENYVINVSCFLNLFYWIDFISMNYI